ncbi:MAG: Ig-like domain-containing protein [Candidatus Micrarchaeota archaeon]
MKIEVTYSDFLSSSPIVVICRPNVVKMCLVGTGSGSCNIICDYPYKGIYTITGTSTFSQCTPALVVSDPNAKPTCALSPETRYGNGTLITKISAKYSNLLPNTTSTTMDCGNGQLPTDVQILDNSAFMTCHYSAESRKEIFFPTATAGIADCSSTITVIPPTDSESPEVSFYNVTYRMALNDTHHLIINATDNVGIEKVKLYIDGVIVSSMSAPPYTYLWNLTNYSRGSVHRLKAEAYDIYGNTAITREHEVYRSHTGERSCNVSASPIYAPIPAAINLTATFNNISSDILFATIKPYSSYGLSNPRIPIIDGVASTIMAYTVAGTYSAYATDGNISCTTKVYITTSPDIAPPTVSITSPTRDEKISISNNITLKATANDNVVLRGVEFYLDNKLLANDTESPFEYPWNTTNERIGYYQIRAIAYDGAGNPSIQSTVPILLYTNKTCEIAPPTIKLLPNETVGFRVTCFNFTKSNASEALTNRTSKNGTKTNFTLITTDVLNLSSTVTVCPELEWSSSLFWSTINPKLSPQKVSFTAQNTDSALSGTITATDPSSGISCTADILILPQMSTCSVEVDTPVIIGTRVPVTIHYDNLTKPQEFHITCRPNVVSVCVAGAGSGSCNTICDYPILGKISLTASSPSTACIGKQITVLPYLDVLPPVISITKPFNAQILKGLFEIEAYATDNFGVSEVEFFVGSEPIGRDTIPPYHTPFNTSEFQNGKNMITARAHDESKNTADFSIEILIAN